MKFSTPLLIFSLFLFTNSCAQDDKGKEIDLKEKELKISVGEKVFLKHKIHNSIGLDVDVEIDDENIFTLYGTEIKYESEERPIPDGGDQALRYYYFEGKSKGEAVLKFFKDYRDQESEIIEIKVIVE